MCMLFKFLCFVQAMFKNALIVWQRVDCGFSVGVCHVFWLGWVRVRSLPVQGQALRHYARFADIGASRSCVDFSHVTQKHAA